tara:strand:+ start:1248 stop:1538 length:291 start_codon:yes stop_codon:yes gene_type:complete
MASKSKAKGNRFEYECVRVLEEQGHKSVRRAFASDGRSLPDCDEDVDILADGIKIQCKVRKTIPKWLQLGTCDWVLVKEDRGEILKITRLRETDGK